MRKLGEGREAEVFEWHDGTALRLFRDGFGKLLDNEETALRAARAGGFRVPEVHERHSLDGRPGLVVERIDGRDQMTLLQRQPWRMPAYAKQLGAVHAALHGVAAPEELTPIREWLRERVGRPGPLPRAATDRVLAEIERLPDGDRLLHGDFHPGNILSSSTGPVAIDWTNATRGHPDADVARTMLISTVGTMPPGASRLVRTFDRFGRSWFVRCYLQGYRRARRFDDADVQRWMVPHAAARLAERIPEETEALIAYVTTRVSST
jgi:aminoglycoside phosphotransferase (APT) family kinase protein